MLELFWRLHASLTRRWWMQLFAASVRCLLALGFVPPSIPKILGLPFTSLPESTNVGYFFNALLKTGFDYEFIGLSQLLAALLLLIPRTAHLGALLFPPIVVNITILTSRGDCRNVGHHGLDAARGPLPVGVGARLPEDGDLRRPRRPATAIESLRSDQSVPSLA